MPHTAAATPAPPRRRGGRGRRHGPAAAAALLLLLGACAEWAPTRPPASAGGAPWPLPAGEAAAVLDQGWDAQTAALYHFTPQGSRLMPRAWFVALETAEDDPPGGRPGAPRRRFAAPENLARYGLLYAGDAGTGLNPDNLPIGFAVDPEDTPETGRWVGLTCAACHTGEVTHRGARLRVEGAPATFDFDRFVADLDAAVQATARDPARLARLAARAGTTPGAVAAPFARYAEHSARHAAVQRPAQASGFSRVDALGQIINALAVLHLDAPDGVREANRRAPAAPVSYPFLWTTPRQEWVQWVPIAGSPIGRNAGEVLGVFGEARLSAPGDPRRFDSSIRFRELVAMEDWLRALRPPPWPEDRFGALDRARWEEGRRIVRANCAGCHNMPPFRLTDPRQSADGGRFIRTSAVPIGVVGTDPVYLRALGAWRIRPGPVADQMADAPGRGVEDGAVAAPDFFLRSVSAVVQAGTARAGLRRRALLDTGEARACPGGTSPRMSRQIPPPVGRYEAADVCTITDGRWRVAPARWTLPPRFLEGMKAGPLLGLWATGPFLHNGSVPTVYDLLSPPAERPRVFWVGGRELDAERLGFVSAEAPGLFRFDTALEGNSNQGHAFPRTPLAPAQRLAVVEYLKDPLRFDPAAAEAVR
jgi:mono/diheme cytochrome c family protein